MITKHNFAQMTSECMDELGIEHELIGKALFKFPSGVEMFQCGSSELGGDGHGWYALGKLNKERLESHSGSFLSIVLGESDGKPKTMFKIPGGELKDFFYGTRLDYLSRWQYNITKRDRRYYFVRGEEEIDITKYLFHIDSPSSKTNTINVIIEMKDVKITINIQ